MKKIVTKKEIKNVTILGNIVLFIFLAFISLTETLNGEEFFWTSACMVLSLSNVYFLRNLNLSGVKKEESWLSLILERKRLEEKVKIDNLKNKK